MPHNNVTENNVPPPSAIGSKLYYNIREVCQMMGLTPYALRSWEKEFPQLRPKKNGAGKRSYKNKDIELISRIKQLVQEEKYTIPGAKKRLTEERREERLGGKRREAADTSDSIDLFTAPASAAKSVSTQTPPKLIKEISGELREILALLER